MPPVRTTLRPSEHPYLNGACRPDLDVIEARSADIDGYLVSFLTDGNTKTSECALIDARRIEDGPVCRIALPHKISSGTHACWADRASL